MTDSLHTGSNVLLDVKTSRVQIIIESKKAYTNSFVRNDERCSSVRVEASDTEHFYLPSQAIKEDYTGNTDLLKEYEIDPLFFEQQDYVVKIKASNEEDRLTFHSNNSWMEESVKPTWSNDESRLSGIINFGNNIGYSSFDIYDNGRWALTVRIEVFPSKISYRADYRAMMEDINGIVAESVFDFLKKTYQEFNPDFRRNNVPAIFFELLQQVYGNFVQAVYRISVTPHHKLVSEHEVLPYYKAKRMDMQSLKWLQKHPENVRKSGSGYSASKVLAVRKRITYDTQENRMVKFMIQSVIDRIAHFSDRYNRDSIGGDKESFLYTIGKMSRDLRRLITTTFLSEVSAFEKTESLSLVFGMAPGYRELYKYYMILQNGLTMNGDVFRMSVRETAVLYEYWCFIKLYSILKQHYVLKSSDIVRVDRNGVTVDIIRGKKSEIKFEKTDTGEVIVLRYNPAYIYNRSETMTVNQKPDNVLSLKKKGSQLAYEYIFDAKYRIEIPALSEAQEAEGSEDSFGSRYPDSKPGPKLDDINTMHRYRDSIVFKNARSQFPFEKKMFGAYVLFPLSDIEAYKDHHFYKSIQEVNIGGLPFLPDKTYLVEDLLEELIDASPETVLGNSIPPVGFDEKLKALEEAPRDILVYSNGEESYCNIISAENRPGSDAAEINKNLIGYLTLLGKDRNNKDSEETS